MPIPEMKLLLQHGEWRSDEPYEDVEERLKRRGVVVDRVHSGESGSLPFESYDLFVSTGAIPDRIRLRVPSYGCISLVRPCHLILLERCGLPVMPWAEAASVRSVEDLFDGWEATRLLLKESGSHSYGGQAVTAFTREAAHLIVAPGRHDVFCPEICSGDGDVYKAELFGGEIMITWKSASAALGELMEGPILKGVMGAYGERELFEFPSDLTTRLEACSRQLERLGYGYCSLDFMRTRDGRFVVIEINGGHVATWWTGQFELMRRRYADAIANLLERSGRSVTARPRPWHVPTKLALVTRLELARRRRKFMLALRRGPC